MCIISQKTWRRYDHWLIQSIEKPQIIKSHDERSWIASCWIIDQHCWQKCVTLSSSITTTIMLDAQKTHPSLNFSVFSVAFQPQFWWTMDFIISRWFKMILTAVWILFCYKWMETTRTTCCNDYNKLVNTFLNIWFWTHGV